MSASSSAEVHSQEGVLRANRRWLLNLLISRFGPLPEELEIEINAVTDLSRLQHVIIQLLERKKLADFQF